MRSSRPFAIANRKGNVRLSRQKSSSNCDIQQGDPMSNLSCGLRSRARKSKIHLERKLFFELFSTFFSRLGKILLLACFLAVFEGKDGLVDGFKNPSASLLRRISFLFVLVLMGCAWGCGGWEWMGFGEGKCLACFAVCRLDKMVFCGRFFGQARVCGI